MRRLIHRRDERGATAVIVSIMLVVLVGFGALAVDVGALWWDKKQLQNGADAAALALAQSCAQGACEADETGMARQYATDNKLDHLVEEVVVSHPSTSSVRVEVANTRQHWLAPVIGIDSSTIPASATAAWGGIGAATVLPLTIKMCNGNPVVGQQLHIVVREHGAQSTSDEPCDDEKNYEGAPGHYAPGNWGWLTPDGDCLVETEADGWTRGHNNPNLPTGYGCEEKLKTLHEQDHVLLPIFDDTRGTGSGAEFRLIGYVSLRVTAFCLDHTKHSGLSANVGEGTPQCQNNNDKWILGEFVEFVDLGAQIGGPDYGSTTVQLTD